MVDFDFDLEDGGGGDGAEVEYTISLVTNKSERVEVDVGLGLEGVGGGLFQRLWNVGNGFVNWLPMVSVFHPRSFIW